MKTNLEEISAGKKRLTVEFREPNKEKYSKYLVQDWFIPRPSDRWVSIYEPLKKKFTRELNKRLLMKAQGDKKQKEESKTEVFFKVSELYKKYGENYEKILSELPDISPYALERYIMFIKRGVNLTT